MSPLGRVSLSAGWGALPSHLPRLRFCDCAQVAARLRRRRASLAWAASGEQATGKARKAKSPPAPPPSRECQGRGPAGSLLRPSFRSCLQCLPFWPSHLKQNRKMEEVQNVATKMTPPPQSAETEKQTRRSLGHVRAGSPFGNLPAFGKFGRTYSSAQWTSRPPGRTGHKRLGGVPQDVRRFRAKHPPPVLEAAVPGWGAPCSLIGVMPPGLFQSSSCSSEGEETQACLFAFLDQVGAWKSHGPPWHHEGNYN